MPAARIYDARICRRYRPYVVIAVVILIFQVILAYSIYKINTVEDIVFTEWKKEGAKHRELLKDKQILSGEKRQDMDEELSDDEDFPSNTAERNGRPGLGLNIAKVPPDKVAGLDSDHQAKDFGFAAAGRHDSFATSHVINLGSRIAHFPADRKEKDAATLRLDQLDFVPDCPIVTKEAISAINRAKTIQCKRRIANLTCLHASGKLYPKRLPRHCPSKGRKMGEHLGCYQDDKGQRLLSGHMKKFSNNTPQRCIDLCLQSGYLLAGVQYGMECFCGDSYPSAKLLESEDVCDIPCPGSASQRCGGFYKMNVYHTGLSKLPKTHSELASTPKNTSAQAKVLYLLTLNGRAVRQVRRLIKALYHVDSYFYIHVDARQDFMYRELLPLESQFPNIRLSRWRRATIWGGASLLQMMLHCMEDALSFIDWNWDFLINLSESDFPIKTHSELVAFLSANKGKNFLKSHGRDTQRFIVKQGLDKTFFECENRMWRTGDRELPLGIRIDGGSDWVGLSRRFCHYLVTAQNELLEGLKLIYQHTLLPAESFFHTVVRNTEFCDSFVDNNLHVTNWKRKVGCRCQYKHVVDWCGCSPNVFKPEDWSRIRSADSRPFYFARKFEPIISQAIVDQLENWLFGPRSREIPATNSYWQNEYHNADLSPPVDDAFLTAYYSFSRLSVDLLEDLVQRCQLSIGHIEEATLYTENEEYKGTLVLFGVQLNVGDHPEMFHIETQVRPRESYQVFRTIGPTSRLKHLQVGTMYDQKEQLFRNFGRIFGPYSEPCLLHKWGEGEAFAATFVWVDPVNTVAGSFEVKLEAGELINFHKPQFQQPLRPGVWTLKFLYKWQLIAETKFLVLPLSYSNRTKITESQARLSNAGPAKKYIDHDFTNVEKLLGYHGDVLLKKFRNASRSTGLELARWIDGLTSQFYTVQDTCYLPRKANSLAASSTSSCLASSLDLCHTVSWSSRYPDPKSEIGVIDFQTGRIPR